MQFLVAYSPVRAAKVASWQPEGENERLRFRGAIQEGSRYLRYKFVHQGGRKWSGRRLVRRDVTLEGSLEGYSQPGTYVAERRPSWAELVAQHQNTGQRLGCANELLRGIRRVYRGGKREG